jgi:hypothetical protein
MAWLHTVIDAPDGRHDVLGGFWSRALGWPSGDPWPDHPELRSFEPPQGEAYVHLQRIDGPTRVHLDLESDDPVGTVAQAQELGAELVREVADWRSLLSPGGLPFCVLENRHREAPGPVTWPGGHRTRLVQVSIDSPADAHDQEVAFWRALLGARWVDSASREFAGKWHDDDGSPLQLLFQRLDDPHGAVGAHLDLAADDVAAEVRRLLELGAEDVGPGRAWHTLRDPAGMAFCVTGNSPEQTRSRDLG